MGMLAKNRRPQLDGSWMHFIARASHPIGCSDAVLGQKRILETKL